MDIYNSFIIPLIIMIVIGEIIFTAVFASFIYFFAAKNTSPKKRRNMVIAFIFLSFSMTLFLVMGVLSNYL